MFCIYVLIFPQHWDWAQALGNMCSTAELQVQVLVFSISWCHTIILFSLGLSAVYRKTALWVLSSLLPCFPRELVLVASLVDSFGNGVCVRPCQTGTSKGIPADSSMQPGLKITYQAGHCAPTWHPGAWEVEAGMELADQCAWHPCRSFGVLAVEVVPLLAQQGFSFMVLTFVHH